MRDFSDAGRAISTRRGAASDDGIRDATPDAPRVGGTLPVVAEFGGPTRDPGKRARRLLLARVMVFGGLLIAPLPLPIGQVIAIIGLSIWVHEDPGMRCRVAGWRRRAPWVSRELDKVRRFLPAVARRLIEETRPADVPEATPAERARKDRAPRPDPAAETALAPAE